MYIITRGKVNYKQSCRDVDITTKLMLHKHKSCLRFY